LLGSSTQEQEIAKMKAMLEKLAKENELNQVQLAAQSQ
jgi:hypothetical protein